MTKKKSDKKADKGMIISAVIIGILVIAIGVLVYVNYIANQDSQNPPPDNSQTSINNPPQQTIPKTYYIAISNHAFSPAALAIKVGDKVIWINNDVTSHTVESDYGFEISSANLPMGNTYSHTFQKIGTYDYSSLSYPSMRGRIIVE